MTLMQFTLREIRESKGYTEEEVAKLYDIPVSKILEIRKDPGSMPASLVMKWRKLYGIPIDYIKI